MLALAFAAGVFVPFHGARAAVSFVQAASILNTSVGSVQVTMANVSAGDVFAVYVAWLPTSLTLNGITDTCGAGGGSNNYTILDNPTTGGMSRAALAYAFIGRSGNCTITATLSGTGDDLRVTVHDLHGATALVGHAINYQNQPGTGTDAITSGNVAGSQKGDYVFGASQDDTGTGSIMAPGTGYAQRLFDNKSSYSGATEDKIQTTSGPVAATFTTDTAYASYLTGIMVFRAGTGVQVSSRSDTLSDSRPSATSNRTLAFTVKNAVRGSTRIDADFPGGFSGTAPLDCGDVDAATSSQFNFNYPSCQATATAWGFSAQYAPLVQSNTVGNGYSASRAVAFPANTATGNTIIVTAQYAGTFKSISDSQGNTYNTAVATTTSPGGYKLQIWYASNVKAGANTVTVTYTSSDYNDLYIFEYTGLGAFDVSHSAQGTGTTANSGGVTTNWPNELIFGFEISDTLVSYAGSSFITRSNFDGNLAEDKLVNIAGSYTATATLTGSAGWAMGVATFRIMSVPFQGITLYAPTDSTSTVHVATGTPVTIKIGTNATQQQNGVHQIVNPSTPGTYTVSVGGTFGGSGNIPVSINSGFEVAATIPEQLSFTVAGVSAQATAKPTFVTEAESAWDGSGSPHDTDLFNIDSGYILVAYCMTENAAYPCTISNSGAALSWTERVLLDGNNQNPYLRMWTATGDSSRSLTVSFSQGDAYFGGNVLVFKDSDGVGNVSSYANGQNSGTASTIITITQGNSAIVVADNDWNALSGGTAADCGSGNRCYMANAGSFIEESYHTQSGNYTIYGGYHADAGSVGTYKVGLSAPAGQRYAIGAIEVKGHANASTCTAADGATVEQVDTTDTAVHFDVDLMNHFFQGCHDLNVSTNAPGGYVLTAQETYAMRTADGTYTIPDTTCDDGTCTPGVAASWADPTKNGLGHTCWNKTGNDCAGAYANGTKFRPFANVAAGNGGIQFVQSATGYQFNTSVNAPFPHNVTAGDVIAVFVLWSSGTDNLTGISDNCNTGGASNAYTLVDNPTRGTIAGSAAMAYAVVGKSGGCTITATLPSSQGIFIGAHDIAGVSAAIPLDNNQHKISNIVDAGNATDAVTSGNINTTANGDYIFGWALNNTSNSAYPAAGTGYTARATYLQTSSYFSSEDRIQASAGTIAATFTNTGASFADFMAGIMAFQSSGSVGSVIMASSTPAIATGRVKYRLSVAPQQAAGTYTTIVDYIITATY